MKINICVNLDEDVYMNHNITDLRLKRKLSEYINNLLRESFDIKNTNLGKDELEEELQQLNIRKAILLEQKKSKEREEEKEAKKWRTII